MILLWFHYVGYNGKFSDMCYYVFFMVEFMIFDGEIYVFLMIFNAEKNKK